MSGFNKMLVKLLSWRLKTLTKTSNNSSPFICAVRFFNHPYSQDEHDPPFKLAVKPPKSNSEPKPKKPSKKPSGTNIKPQEAVNLPFKSDLPFDFRYSYSESNPDVEPISYREPKRFSPFGPGRLDRKWTGTAAPAQDTVDVEKIMEVRNRILGKPLSEAEVEELVERYRHNDCSRQINLGK